MSYWFLAQTEPAATEGFGQLAPPLQIALLLGALSIAVSLLVCVTAFTRIIIVLSFVRRALATQEIPPNPVILGLSGFLTLYVMAPTFHTIYEQAVVPYLKAQESPGTSGDFTLQSAWEVASRELKRFMLHNTRESDLWLFTELATRGRESTESESAEESSTMSPTGAEDPWGREFRTLERDDPFFRRLQAQSTAAATSPDPLAEELGGVIMGDTSEEDLDWTSIPLATLIPAFIISELKTAFIMGFCIYIPFLLIDLVVSTVLMALGMMMMPPVVVATPCKLLLFVLVDGWQLIAQALVTSFHY